jgi:hypothetical protein
LRILKMNLLKTLLRSGVRGSARRGAGHRLRNRQPAKAAEADSLKHSTTEPVVKTAPSRGAPRPGSVRSMRYRAATDRPELLGFSAASASSTRVSRKTRTSHQRRSSVLYVCLPPRVSLFLRVSASKNRPPVWFRLLRVRERFLCLPADQLLFGPDPLQAERQRHGPVGIVLFRLARPYRAQQVGHHPVRNQLPVRPVYIL